MAHLFFFSVVGAMVLYRISQAKNTEELNSIIMNTVIVVVFYFLYEKVKNAIEQK